MGTRSLTIGTTEERLCDANEYRTAILIVNTDAANTLYVSDEVSEANSTNGIPIKAGQNLELNEQLGYDVSKIYYVSASAANTTGILFESYKRAVTSANQVIIEQATPGSNKSLAARCPCFGNRAIVQVYFRKLRDRVFSKELHKKLHPLI